jgi:predicted MFS family arabinose efflux permease
VTDRHYSSRRVGVAVGLLAAAVSVEFFHRQILAVAIEPLREELGLSDTQAGTLVFAFGAAYAVFALVLGRLADRTSRRNVYAAGIAVWSAATALGGACAGFAALLATRLAVGAAQGAAGACNGPLVADYVRPERRAGAMGLIAVGGAIGVVGALTAGGYATESLGWRAAFAWSGAAGLVFALAFAVAVDEPPRGWSEGRRYDAGAQPGLAAGLRAITAQPVLPHAIAGAVLGNVALLTTAQWGPAFFMRVHQLGIADAGVAGGAAGLFAVAGGVAGGLIADRAWARDARNVLRIPAVCFALACPTSVAAFLWPTSFGALALLVVTSSLGMIHAAPLGAVVQALTPLRSRALVTGTYNALITLVAAGGGPLLIGWLSDVFAGGDAGAGLARALALGSLFFGWAAVHLFLAARHLVAGLERARAAAA